MILRPGQVEDLRDGEHGLELPEHRLHWRGFVYLPGHLAGAPSLAACDWSGADATARSARALKGSFALSVLERDGGAHRVFTDASGSHDLFVAGRIAATSFLDLCRATGVRAADLDPPAMAEFLDLGSVLGRRTLAPAIARLAPGRVHELVAGSAERTFSASIADPAPPGLTVERHFAALAESLRGLRVSVDLTGGCDSRMVAALLAPHLDFECAVSGVPGYADLPIAARVARALDRPLHVTGHDLDGLEDDIPRLFEDADGLLDLLEFHRLRAMVLGRRERGVDVALGGMGGELFAESWWLQEFPRYRKAHIDLERLFDLRIRSRAIPPEVLAGDVARAAEGVRGRALAEMRELVMPLNTQTIDRVVYDVRMRGRGARITTAQSPYVPVHHVLLDLDLVRMSYALARRARFYDRFHRRAVSTAAPAAAAIRTWQGITLRDAPAAQVADLGGYAGDKLRRLTGKARQRLLGTPLRQPDPDHPGMRAAARETEAFRAAEERLRDAGVLSGAEVPPRYAGRVLTLGLLWERLAG